MKIILKHGESIFALKEWETSKGIITKDVISYFGYSGTEEIEIDIHKVEESLYGAKYRVSTAKGNIIYSAYCDEFYKFNVETKEETYFEYKEEE